MENRLRELRSGVYKQPNLYKNPPEKLPDLTAENLSATLRLLPPHRPVRDPDRVGLKLRTDGHKCRPPFHFLPLARSPFGITNVSARAANHLL